MAGFSRPSSSSLLLAFLLLGTIFSSSEAKEILVGGKSDSWTIPSSQSQSLNKWAESTRFRIGDTLVWKYDGEKDWVVQVSKEDYLSCNSSSPIEEYKDGQTKVKLNKAGPYYFISGAKGHCEKGQKLIVVVLSPRHRYAISPAPSPAEFDGPAVAPTSGAEALRGGGLVVGLGGFLLLWGLF
ncbi:Early nodulin-like protein 1 [Morus notabilis]|uniref:Early nodulin-like protein 1 n=1 Tax=Morus notabilis TaxID=981085 RepID=W9REK8_9ROSA|nr:early nodulin-like protein 1 [Morus notabilis]EXB86670.1 Early nodulin-like protein 1 [Morus notabilis]